jgi:hypothetical protein
MAQSGTVVTLTQETLPIFLAIFGDLSAADAYRGSRRLIRRPSRIPIEFLRMRGTSDAEMLPAECVDISEAGIGFGCEEELRVGEIVEVYLPGESQEYVVRVQIIHVTPRGGRYRVGGKFVWR